MELFNRKTFLPKIIGLLVLTLFTTACAEQKLVRGHLLRESQLQQIQIGVSDKREVVEILGNPTVENSFGGAVWYYIGQRRTKDGFLPAEMNALEIYQFNFDSGDILQAVNFIDHNNLQLLSYNENRTATRGAELTAIQQLFGNVGRFGTPESHSGGVRDLLEP